NAHADGRTRTTAATTPGPSARRAARNDGMTEPTDPGGPPVPEATAPEGDATLAAPGAAPGPDASTGMRTERTSGLVRAGGVMAAGTLVSRITGFLAKAILLSFFGAWVVNDSYYLANTLPKIIFELLLGGVLTSVAIPLLSRARSDAD